MPPVNQQSNRKRNRGRMMSGRCEEDSFQFITSTSHYDLSLKPFTKGGDLTFFRALVGYFHSILTEDIFSILTEIQQII